MKHGLIRLHLRPRTSDLLLACLWTGLLLGQADVAGTAGADGPSVVQAGVVGLIIQGVLAIASLTAGLILAKRNPAVLKDDNPQTTATRGSFAPLVIGRRRVGPIIAWVGSRAGGDFSAQATGKRGRSSTHLTQKVWHIVCVGPATRLHRIWVNGKIVFDQHISPQDFKSGLASIGIPNVGIFVPYWGERDQPSDPDLTAANGFASAMHGVFSIMWNLDLGDVPQHPLIEYEVECAPRSQLVGSSPWINPTLTDAAAGAGWPLNPSLPYNTITRQIFVSDQGGIPAYEAIQIGSVVRLSGQVATDLFGHDPAYCYITGKVVLPSQAQFQTGVEYQGVVTNPQTPVAGNRVAPLGTSTDDGANLAHCLDQLMFAPGPWGAAVDRSEFDIASLEEVGIALSEFGEGLRGNVILADGETFEAKIAGILQDIGCFLALDPVTGKQRFYLIREPAGALPSVPEQLVLPPKPEIQRLHAARPADKVQFAFLDREHSYRKMTFTIQDDGRANYAAAQRHREVEIVSTTDAASASKIGARRSQEELAAPTKYRIAAQGQARELVPGVAFKVEGIDHVLRLIGVDLDVRTSAVKLHALVDAYGLPAPAFEASMIGGTGGQPDAPKEPVPDAMVMVFEPPAFVVNDKVKIAVARVRGSPHVIGAHVWISLDDTTYKRIGEIRPTATAGVLNAPLPATTPPIVDQITDAIAPVGVDEVAVLEDLGGNDEAWLAGAQVMLVGDEIMFVRSTTLEPGGDVTLDGVVRGRFGTVRATHAGGASALIAQASQIRYFADVLLVPGKTVYVKVQPFTMSAAMNLADITPVQVTLRGKAFAPPDPLNVNVTNRTRSYRTGEAVPLRWHYRSSTVPFTGAGMQPAGHPTGVSPVQGEFVVRMKVVPEGTVVREVNVGQALSYAYANADMLADFGGEPAEFDVDVVNVQSGFASDAATARIAKV